MSPREPMTRMYRVAMSVNVPVVRTWGRLEITGLDVVPESGPLLIVGNHDSYWDPVAVGVAALRRRQIRALAKKELWGTPGLHWVLDGMGQIPLDRGAGDAHAFDRAVQELRAGACIGVFPEGTRSKGQPLRARSGIGRLARALPDAPVVSVAIRGTTDISRFPRRPRVALEFFVPAGGSIGPDEEPAAFAQRLVAELRAKAPVDPCGRRPGAGTAGA